MSKAEDRIARGGVQLVRVFSWSCRESTLAAAAKLEERECHCRRERFASEHVLTCSASASVDRPREPGEVLSSSDCVHVKRWDSGVSLVTFVDYASSLDTFLTQEY